MKIERVISVFQKDQEFLFKEININEISLSNLKDIFKPSIEDPLMYNCYPIGFDETLKLREHFEIEFNLKEFDYYLECYQV